MARRSLISWIGLAVLISATQTQRVAFAQEQQTAADLSQAIESAKAAAAAGPGYDAVFHRDPMRPLVDQEGNLVASVGYQGGLSVQGIIWSDDRPLVVVDDELFAKGATVGPYTITDIQPNGITVTQGSEAKFIPS